LPVKDWLKNVGAIDGIEPLLPSDSKGSDDHIDLVKNCAIVTGGGMTFGIGLAAPLPHMKIAYTCDVAIGDVVKYLFKEMGAAVKLFGDEADQFEGAITKGKGGFYWDVKDDKTSMFLQEASKHVPWKSPVGNALQP